MALLMWRICHDLAAEEPRIETGPATWPPIAGAAGTADANDESELGIHIPRRVARTLVVPLAAAVGFLLGRSRRKKVTRL